MEQTHKYSSAKEYLRKKLVYVKRNPQVFPKLFLIISCIFFTFNLTPYSYAAVDISATLPAFNLFAVTLLSFMAVISFVTVKNDYKKSLAPVIITLVFAVTQIALQIFFIITVNKEINALAEGEIALHASWPRSITLTVIHLVLLFLSLAAIILMPIYAKLLQRINTTRPDMLEEELAEKSAENEDFSLIITEETAE